MSTPIQGIEDFQDFEASLVIDADFAESDFGNQAYSGAAGKHKAWSAGQATADDTTEVNKAEDVDRPATPDQISHSQQATEFEPFDRGNEGAVAEEKTEERPADPVPPTNSEKREVDVSADDEMTGDKNNWYGKRLGNYRLKRVLGTGNFGVVFQAEDINLQRTTALKVLRRRIAGATEKERVQLFLQEARAVAAIDHPNIVQIYEINDMQGWWYIAMEYLEGGNLLNLIKNTGALDPARATIMIADAASGLAEAHEMGIIHRDIKPDNLMLTRRGICKVADFGLVKADDPNDPFQVNKVRVGTPLYMAPEVILKKGATAASDVYSLSATLYVLLSKRPPFVGKTRNEILKNHLHAEVPDIREHAPHVRESLATLIRNGMSKDPKQRPSAEAMSAALRSEMAMSSLAQNSQASMSVSLDPISSTSQVSQKSMDLSLNESGGSVQQPKKSNALLVTLVTLLIVVLLGGGGYAGFIAMNPDQNPFIQNKGGTNTAGIGTGALAPVEEVKATREQNRTRAEAIAANQRIAGYEDAHGFKQMKTEHEAVFLLAQAAFESGDFEAADADYKKYIEAVSSIDAREKLRNQAREARKKMELSQQHTQETLKAGEAGGETPSLLKSASVMAVSAAEAYTIGDFELATQRWAQARAGFVKAGETAVGYNSYVNEKAAFQTAFAAMSQSELTQFGGEQWKQLQDSMVKAETMPQNQQTADLYKKMTTDLPRLASFVKDTRSKKIADMMAQAQSYDNDIHGQKGLAILNEVLKISPDHQEALSLQNKIQAYFKPGRILTNKIGMRLAYVPAGTFQMGSDGGELKREEDERRHEVKISDGFYIGSTEVTWKQWKTVMKDYKSDDGDDPKISQATLLSDDQPVTHVTFKEAELFCKKLSELTGRTYRLPTEAEWEYAARAGSQDPFHTGKSLTFKQAHIDGYEAYLKTDELRPASELPTKTVAVGSFTPNAWGLYDMHGNVQEWCADWYGPYPLGKQVDPKGPEKTNDDDAQRVVRGGSYQYGAAQARLANRMQLYPQNRDAVTGFRVVLENK